MGGQDRLVVGNWKMHKTVVQAQDLIQALRAAQPRPPAGVRVIVCPPFTALAAVSALTGDGIGLGAQDVAWADAGAFTGEVSAAMLRDLGCGSALVGHSERRTLLGETDRQVRDKLLACRRHGLVPLLCVGETLAERQANVTGRRLGAQVAAALDGVEPGPLWVAYEPVWAIGSGQAATPQDCRVGLAVLRAALRTAWGDESAGVACLYGGSVTAANAGAFVDAGEADGLLVGGASLDAAAFAGICRAAGGGAA